MVHQLLDGISTKQLREAGLDSRYVEHGLGIYPMDSGGFPQTAASIQSKGDPITDLYEDMAADGAPLMEQQSRIYMDWDLQRSGDKGLSLVGWGKGL